MKPEHMREEYLRNELNEDGVPADPIELFNCWFNEAVREGIPDANAMALATVSADGQPSSRMVLLKGLEYGAFVFFTNGNSRKGRELAQNNRASLLFFWQQLERQVRIEGTVSRIPAADSDAYFAVRPFESQAAAAASPQSEVIPDREMLEQAYELQLAKNGIERPPHWGGFALKPEMIEFWQGRKARLHDRIRYRKLDGGWVKERLAP